MATAPFDSAIIRVPLRERGASYQGHTLGARLDALTYHLVKRVGLEEQWRDGLTAAQYLDDLRRATRHPAARLTVYQRRGGHIAVTMTATDSVVPVDMQAVGSLPWMLVIYSADRGIIVTGYQFSEPAQTGVPEDVRWLA